MENLVGSDAYSKLVKEEFPQLFDKNGQKLTYLDHAGASLHSKSQTEGICRDLSENLLCNPHTNYGNLRVIISYCFEYFIIKKDIC